VNNDDFLDVQFTLGGGHDAGNGPATCRFAVATNDTSESLFDENVVQDGIPCTVGSYTNSIPISANQTGINYLQFVWNAGDGSHWYNCVQLNVLAGAAIQINSIPSIDVWAHVSIDAESSNVSAVYNSITVPAITDSSRNIHISFNGTIISGEVNFTSSTVLPRNPLIGNTRYVTSDLQSDIFCNPSATTTKIYVSLFPSADYIGNVSFIVTEYDAVLDFVTAESIPITIQKGESFYFESASYSTLSDQRRFTISGSGGNAYAFGPFSTCGVQNVFYQTINHCIDLPIKQESAETDVTYYYYVTADNTYTGQVDVEKGNCSSYSGVSTLILSIGLLLVVLLIN